jgi:urea transport system substrate-binding protein
MTEAVGTRAGLARRRLLGGVAAGAAAAAMPAVAQPRPIRIGVPVGLSGANSVVAPSVVQSAELAVAEVNAAGGVLGRPLALEVADDGSGATGAQRAFESLVFQRQVDALISMETSAARNAGLPIVTRGRKPFIYTSFYEGRSCNRYMYVNAWVPDQQVAPIVDHFMGKRGARAFYLVGSDYAFGRGMLAFTKAYVERKGGRLVGEDYQPMDASDWTAVVGKIRSAAPDAVIMSTAGGAPNVTLTKQYRAAGLRAPVGNLAVDEGTAKSMGSDAEGILISGSYFTNIDTPANRRFLEAMRQKFGNDLRTPNDLSVPQYEAIHLYKAAVEKAGTVDTDPVVRALAEVSFDGPRGTIRMNKQRHTPLDMYLGEVQADGSVRILETARGVDPGAQCPNLA